LQIPGQPADKKYQTMKIDLDKLSEAEKEALLAELIEFRAALIQYIKITNDNLSLAFKLKTMLMLYEIERDQKRNYDTVWIQ
jgi:hypothetical protein